MAELFCLEASPGRQKMGKSVCISFKNHCSSLKDSVVLLVFCDAKHASCFKWVYFGTEGLPMFMTFFEILCGGGDLISLPEAACFFRCVRFGTFASYHRPPSHCSLGVSPYLSRVQKGVCQCQETSNFSSLRLPACDLLVDMILWGVVTSGVSVLDFPRE